MATQAQIEQFIEQIAPIIQKYAKLYGYKVASPIIAQACIESAYGTSSLGYKHHNYFGMKCGSSWKGASVNLSTKEEYTVGTLTNIKANFRKYDSMDAGVKGYFDFISAKRYANLKDATTAQQYLEYIKADGYATSSKYVNTNMNVVNKYNLIRYDDFSGNSTIEVNVSKKYTVGRNYILQSNMYIRESAAGEKKPFLKLTTNAKSNGYQDEDGNGILKKKTVVTCKGIETLSDGAMWMKIPSGYVCAVGSNGKVYIM